MKKFFYFLLLLSFQLLITQANSADFIYISPKPGSDYNSLQTNIIFRSAELIDPATLEANLVSVMGSKSGIHTGKLILSDDSKTLLFNPDSPFEPSENVTVNLKPGILTTSGKSINKISIKFTTTSLKQPLDNDIINDEGSSNNIPAALLKTDEILADTLPPDMVPLTITSINNPDKGYYFLTLGSYLMILNDTGKVIKYKKVTPSPSNFEVQQNGLYSYISGGKAFITDTSLKILDSVTTQNGYKLDGHEFVCLPNGHYLVMSYDPQYVDMSKVVPKGFPSVKVTGCVFQELDRNKNVVFQWRTWDYFQITDSYQRLDSIVSVDAIHSNSMFYDIDGNIIISSRHISSITKINRQTGDVMWRLGGKNNDFTFIGENESNKPTYFSYQHNMRRNANGNFTLYDNGNQHSPNYSRAVEYKLDEAQKTATLVWEYRHTPDVYGAATGNVHRTANGNTVIGWGMASRTDGQPQMTEVHPDKTIALELSVPTTASTYRVFKYRLPACPAVATVNINDIQQGQTYNFANKTDTTGVEVKFNVFVGSFYPFFRIQRFDCPPVNPEFDTVPKIVLPYKIKLLVNADDYAGEFHIDITKFPTIIDPANTFAYITDSVGVYHRIPTTYNSTKKILVFQYSSIGDVVFGIPPALLPAQKPLLVQPADKAILNIKLKNNYKWTTAGEFSACQVRIATDNTFNNLVLDTLINNSDNFNLNPVLAANTYYWSVRSKNSQGFSAWSDAWSFTLANPYITMVTPNGGEVMAKDTNYHFILWKHNLADTVKIELYRKGVYETTIKDSLWSPLGGYAWKIPTGITEDSTYAVKITSKKDTALTAISMAYFTIKEWQSGVEEIAGVPAGFISPNPVQDFILLANSGFDRSKNIYIFSISGILVFESKYSDRLDVSALNSGVYFLTCGKQTFKFIKEK